MRLDLAAVVQLRVERLALRVVPVLVDPAERRVVGPGGLEPRVVEPLHHLAQRGRRHGEEARQPDVAEQAGQIERQLVEDELQERRVPLGLVAAERRGELPQLR